MVGARPTQFHVVDERSKSKILALRLSWPLVKPNLCSACRYGKETRNDRASVFLFCLRSKHDPAFPKYPRLPVIACAGFEKKECLTKTSATDLLIDKLSVQAGMRVAVIGLEDPGFLTLLAVRTADFTKRLRPDCDVILLGVEKTALRRNS